MNTRTGKIYNLSNFEPLTKHYDDDDRIKVQPMLGHNLTQLSDKENEVLGQLAEQDRPEQLALMRFIDERKRLGAPYGLSVQNAFRLGYRAAAKDNG